MRPPPSCRNGGITGGCADRQTPRTKLTSRGRSGMTRSHHPNIMNRPTAATVSSLRVASPMTRSDPAGEESIASCQKQHSAADSQGKFPCRGRTNSIMSKAALCCGHNLNVCVTATTGAIRQHS